MSIWDDPALQAPPEADYVKFERVGDGFDGRIVTVTKQTFDDGTAAPMVTFIDDSDGETRNWTAGQIDAKRKLAELRPDAGDHISVRFVGTTGKFKHIEIKLNARGYQQPQSQTASALSNGQAYQQQPVTAPGTPPLRAADATVVHLPTFEQAPSPVASNLANGHTQTAPPAGVDAAVWARMDAEQRQQLLTVMGGVPAF